MQHDYIGPGVLGGGHAGVQHDYIGPGVLGGGHAGVHAA